MKLEKDEVIRREKDIYREGTNDVRPQGNVLDAKLSSNAAKFGLRKVRVQVCEFQFLFRGLKVS